MTHKPFPIIGIGASAGGPEALTTLLGVLPARPGAAIVVVQHPARSLDGNMGLVLAESSRLPVLRVREGIRAKPDCIYLVPPGKHVKMRAGVFRANGGSASGRNGFPIDGFLSSLAADRESLAMGVLLSGDTVDGTRGLQAIRAQGGVTSAQDRHTASHPRMPATAAAAGCADFVLPPDGIAKKLIEVARHLNKGAAKEAEALERQDSSGAFFREVCRVLSETAGGDFRCYQPSAIYRRIARRMLLRQEARLDRYLALLGEMPAEAGALCQEIFSHSNGFFHSPADYRTLQRKVLPRLLAARTAREPLRVWVPGCATGEDVYSIGILLLEMLDSADGVQLQLFGTDVNESAIAKAHTGVYAPPSLANVGRERLRRFFEAAEGGYRICKPLRESCVFGRHDLTTDPPFSRLDLLSCRGVLSPMQPAVQQRVFEVFHYALQPGGCLFLGGADTVLTPDRFVPEERRSGIYTKARSGDASAPRLAAARAPGVDLDRQVASLERELAQSRDVIRSFEQGSGSAIEELAAANEEISAMNEELRCSTRELELSKAELASTNEELSLLNEGLQKRNAELSLLTAELGHVFTALNTAIVILDGELRIRRFSPKAEELLRLIAPDVGRPFLDIATGLPSVDWEPLFSEALNHLRPVEKELEHSDGRWYALRLRPYITTDNSFAGVLITLVDIDLVRRSLEEARNARDFAESIVDTAHEPILVLDGELRVLRANPAYYDSFLTDRAETVGRLLSEVGAGFVDAPVLRHLLEEILPSGTVVKGLEIEATVPALGRRSLVLNARQIRHGELGTGMILLAIEDVTESREHEVELLRYDQELRALTARVISAREAESKRVARELHDAFSQELAVIGLGIASARATATSAAAQELATLGERVNELARAMHDMSRRLHPAVLDELGLGVALRNECVSFSRQQGIPVDCRIGRLPASLPQETALCLYRISQECLQNIGKHAHASGVVLTLSQESGEMKLAIVDNGRGFAPDAVRGRGGIGLVGMEERARLTKGRLVIESKPGRGTRVEVRIPLKKESE